MQAAAPPSNKLVGALSFAKDRHLLRKRSPRPTPFIEAQNEPWTIFIDLDEAEACTDYYELT